MNDLADDFPEAARIAPVVRCYDLGCEPSAADDWHEATPAQRLRAAELLRRIAYSHDPSTPISNVVRFIDRRGG